MPYKADTFPHSVRREVAKPPVNQGSLCVSSFRRSSPVQVFPSGLDGESVCLHVCLHVSERSMGIPWGFHPLAELPADKVRAVPIAAPPGRLSLLRAATRSDSILMRNAAKVKSPHPAAARGQQSERITGMRGARAGTCSFRWILGGTHRHQLVDFVIGDRQATLDLRHAHVSGRRRHDHRGHTCPRRRGHACGRPREFTTTARCPVECRGPARGVCGEVYRRRPPGLERRPPSSPPEALGPCLPRAAGPCPRARGMPRRRLDRGCGSARAPPRRLPSLATRPGRRCSCEAGGV